MTGVHYVYMLSDVSTHTHHYVGVTEDLKTRLSKHNSGQVKHTSKFAPWIVDAAMRFVAKVLQRTLSSISNQALAVHSPTNIYSRNLEFTHFLTVKVHLTPMNNG